MVNGTTTTRKTSTASTSSTSLQNEFSISRPQLRQDSRSTVQGQKHQQVQQQQQQEAHQGRTEPRTTPTIKRPQDSSNNSDECAYEFWRRRLPSQNLSFGAAEILSVSECLLHAQVYHQQSVRVTGILTSYHQCCNNPQEQTSGFSFSPLMMCLHLKDPLTMNVPKNHAPAVAVANVVQEQEQPNMGGGNKTSSRLSTVPSQQSRAQSQERLSVVRGSSSLANQPQQTVSLLPESHSSVKKQPRLLVRRRKSSLTSMTPLGGVSRHQTPLSTTTTPTVTARSNNNNSFHNDNRTKNKRPWAAMTDNTPTIPAATATAISTSTSVTMQQQGHWETECRTPSHFDTSTFVEDQSSKQKKKTVNIGDDSSPCLCVWADPQHVAGLGALSVGGLVMVMGQLQWLQKDESPRERRDDYIAEARQRGQGAIGSAPRCSETKPDEDHQDDASSSSRDCRTLGLSARLVQNVSCTTDMTLYTRALVQRRQVRLLQWHREQQRQQRQDQEKDPKRTPAGPPALLLGCGPPPYQFPTLGGED
jgi:hypothetical protein